MFTCAVNAVGPVSGPLVTGYMLDRDPRDTYDPIIVITLTELSNAFVSQNFVVDDSSIYNWILATALAAINGGFTVSADVDWPLPGPDQDGNPQPGLCRVLILNTTNV
jgi:hypothetical protein